MTASIQKKGNSYYIVVSGFVVNGKSVNKWVSTGYKVSNTPYKTVEKKRREVLEQYKSLEELENFEHILFSDYLKSWLEDIKYSIAENTYESYKITIHKVICPYFESKKILLHELKPKHIQSFYNYKMEHEGVSANTIHHYQANIHKALEHAVKNEQIPKNPSDNVILPKKEKHMADYYSEEEIKQLLNAAKGDKLESVVMIAVYLGMRRGEIIGLKWDCVDFARKAITVKGTMIKADGLKYSPTTKHSASLRTLPMTDELASYLFNLKERQEQNRKRLGKKYNSKWSEFVCVHDNGDIITLDYASRRFSDVCKKAGLRRVQFHKIRHSNISLLARSGYSMKEIQVWAGHNDYSTTANIYSHIQYTDKQKFADTISKALSN